MAATEIKVRMQQRRDTAAGWTSADPVLLTGELGYETDTGYFKLGDGSTAWSSLAYLDFSKISAYPLETADLADDAVTSAKIADGTIVNADVNASAAIADTKLDTISTAGKVSNSATTATDANTASAIVARDASGDFSAGTITADLSGNASTVTTNANLTGDVTSVGNATSIAAGAIVDADVNASAAIAGTKIDPDFGSQTVETTGVFSAAGGAAATPSIAFTGDLDTGIYSPGANQVALATNGTGRLFVDSSGRVLLGTTTVGAAAGDNLTIEDSSNAGITIRSSAVGAGSILFEDTASDRGEIQYSHNGDFMRFKTAGGERMRIDSSGNVEVKGGAELRVYRSDNTRYGRFYTDGFATILEANPSPADPLRLVSTDRLEFYSGSNEQMRIDSSGRLLVGTSTSIRDDALLQVYKASGAATIVLESGSLSNGQLAALQVTGGSRKSVVGVYKHAGITNSVSYIRLDEEDGAFQNFWVDNSGQFRISTSSAHVGTTSGTVVGTQTSDERLKNVGGNVSYGLNEVLQLQPKQYALKSDPDTNKLGFIAQEVESIIPEAIFDTNEELEGHQEGDRTKLGMEYVQLIPVLVNAIKEQQETIIDLQTRLAALDAQ